MKDVARIAVSNVDKKSIKGQQAVRLCNYTDVYYNDRITENLKFMRATATPEQVRDFRLIRGDVLITKDSETVDDIAVPALVEAGADDLLCGYHLALIRPDSTRIEPRFLYWTLASTSAREWFSTQATGVTRFGLRSQSISDARIRLPALGHQRAIADLLDAETARIDALIEKKHQLVDLLRQRWAIARRSAVTIGIDARAPRRSTAIPWFQEVPVHWRMSKLHHLADIRSGSTPSTEREDYWEGDVPWVSPKDMKRFEIDSSQNSVTERAVAEAGLRIAPAGCVLFVVRGMILAHTFPVALNSVQVTINQDMKVLSLKQDDPRFLAHLLVGVSDSVLALLIEESAHGTRVLRMDRWKGFPLFLPPLDEQRQIVRFLDDETDRVQSITRRLDQQIILLKEHRQALITAAVTGQLDVVEAAA